MDKVKSNFMIVLAVLVVLCIVLAGSAANLNSRLNAEKIKILQLNDQIAGLNAKAGDLQKQLTSVTGQANDQAKLASSLQNSLNTANTELGNLKIAYADLESKLKTQISAETLQPAATETVPAK